MGAHWLIFIVNNNNNNYNNNFICPAKMNQLVNKWTHTWIYNLYDASTRKSGQFDNLLSWKTNWCPFLMHLSCYWQKISSQHCQSSLQIHSAFASWILLLWQLYDKIHDQQQDRCMKNWWYLPCGLFFLLLFLCFLRNENKSGCRPPWPLP